MSDQTIDQRTNQMTARTMSSAGKWLLMLLLFAAPVLSAQTIPFDLEAGYRWFDVSGNEGMYRTQINERSGFIIRRLSLATGDFEGRTGLVDRFRLDISDLGVGPAGSLRLEADRNGLYRMRLAYRGTEAFSELPAFANPLFAQGVVPGQHTYDRTRRMIDIDVGYTWNDSDSQGLTTYHLGQDEFLLNQDLREQNREGRFGADFRFRTVYGRITQGWRSVSGTEALSLRAGSGAGNSPGSVIGRPVLATDITRNADTEGSTPFTNLFVTGQLMKRLRVTGNFARLTADTDSTETEGASGAFASFALGRFYNGLSGNLATSAKNDTWRGGVRAEFELAPNVDLSTGFAREHRELEGTALINAVFLQSITFGGADSRDLETILRASSSIDRDEDTFHVAASARAVGPFAFRAEYRNASQDVTVAPDLVEIVVPGNQGGTFSRAIRTLDTSASYTRAGLSLGAAWRSDRADDPIFRTDFLGRDRIRVRAAWTSPKDFFRAGVTAEDLDQDNDRTDIGYDANTRQYSADVDVAPIPMFRLRGSYSQFRTDSTIQTRRPENFTITESVYAENGKSKEGGISFQRAAFSVDAGLTRFENEGTLPFDLERYRARLTYDFKSRIGVAAEWNRDAYHEASPARGDYEATRYGIYLRWSQ